MNYLGAESTRYQRITHYHLVKYGVYSGVSPFPEGIPLGLDIAHVILFKTSFRI